MYFDGSFRKLGYIEIGDLKDKVLGLPEEFWLKSGARQKQFKVHESTQSLPLIFDPDFRHRFPTEHPDFEIFQDSLTPAMNTIREYFRKSKPPFRENRQLRTDKGYFARVLLVRLMADSEIAEHTDHGYSLSRAHRIHLPVITNDQVEFTVGDNYRHLAEGELWEVNNRTSHSVRNSSACPRVHFILDFVIPNELIYDPAQGEIFA